MLNKKILAATIAATFAFNANAVVDATVTNVVAVSYASEAIKSADLKDGYVVASNANNSLDVKVKAGFAIPINTTRFVRVELTNAKFETALDSADLVATTAGATGPDITYLTGGAKGDTFAVYQVAVDGTAGDVVLSTDTFTIASDDLNISTTMDVVFKYTMHADLGTAVGGTSPIVTKEATIAKFAAGTTGTFTTKGASAGTKALVAKDFKEVTAVVGANSATEVLVGSVDTSGYLKSPTLFNYKDDAVIALSDVLDNSQKLSFAGDFSFGTWSVATNDDCDTGEILMDLTGTTVATTKSAVDVTAGAVYFLCSENSVKKDVIKRGAYSATLADDKMTGSLASITYDTTSVAIPFLTTYSGYNQRIYLINSGSSAAAYSVSFKSEAGTTAQAGTMGSGTIPANSIISVKATDLAVITGTTTRTSATIEIEAAKESIKATSQTVTKGDGSTDTVDLVVTQ